MASGVAWMAGARMIVRALGALSTLILARLLAPSDFGLIAMATSLIALLELLSAFSFDLALIRRPDSTADDFDTAWTLNVLFALAIALVLFVSAPFAADFYREPRLQTVMYLVAAGNCLRSFQNIGTVEFRKQLRFDRDFRLQVFQKLSQVLIAVPLAFVWRSYWALIAGMIAGNLASLIVSYWMIPRRPRLILKSTRELFSFSGWVALNNAINFLRNRAGDLIIGRVAGTRMLGLFNVAYEISNLPTTEMVAPINRAVFPGYVQLAHDPQQLRQAFRDVLGFVCLLSLPVCMGVASIAELLVPFLLGSKWTEAGPLVALLAVSGGFNTLQANTGAVYHSLGKPRLIALTGGIQMLALIPMLIFAASRYGVVGAAVAHLLHSLIFGAPVTYSIMTRTTPVRWGDFVGATWRPVTAVVLMYACVRLLGFSSMLSSLGDTTRIAACVAIGVISYAIALWICWQVAGKPPGAETMMMNRIGQWLRRRASAAKSAA
jgi:O-antigen/teichoic acid export membrane protein